MVHGYMLTVISFAAVAKNICEQKNACLFMQCVCDVDAIFGIAEDLCVRGQAVYNDAIYSWFRLC